MRTKYRWDAEQNKFVEYWRDAVESKAPVVIDDTWDPTLNHCDNKVYTSRSQYYRAAKEAGCIEIDRDEAIRRIGQRDRERRERAVAGMADPHKLRDTIERVHAELLDNRRPVFKAPDHVVEQWRKVSEE